MFTLRQIEDAHSKVKSGADFPQYIRDLIAMGVSRYSIYVNDGHAEYVGNDGHTVLSEAEYEKLHIISDTDIIKFKQYLEHINKVRLITLLFVRIRQKQVFINGK